MMPLDADQATDDVTRVAHIHVEEELLGATLCDG